MKSAGGAPQPLGLRRPRTLDPKHIGIGCSARHLMVTKVCGRLRALRRLRD